MSCALLSVCFSLCCGDSSRVFCNLHFFFISTGCTQVSLTTSKTSMESCTRVRSREHSPTREARMAMMAMNDGYEGYDGYDGAIEPGSTPSTSDIDSVSRSVEK